jgi:AraC-like DNA-binding protein
MSLIFEERQSDSPYVELITTGRTTGSSTTIRPAEVRWHMVIARFEGSLMPIITGPLTSSGVVNFVEGIELLWIKFKLGVFTPRLPVRGLLNTEIMLPEAGGKSFWLDSTAWQLPNYENADTFVNRLIREGTLEFDPVVNAALCDELPAIPQRTVRHRFQRATGLTHAYIRQYERAQYAASLLRQGRSILDTVFDAGYFDQPHMTRSLKQFVGYTPAQLASEYIRSCENAAQTARAERYVLQTTA